MDRDDKLPDMLTHHLPAAELCAELEAMHSRAQAAFNSQLQTVDHIVQKDPATGELKKLDGHMWLVKAGQIEDPTLEAGLHEYMRSIARAHGLPSDPVELVYEEFQGDLKREVWRAAWRHIKKQARFAESQGFTREEMFQELHARPRPQQCVLNTWARHVLLKDEGIRTRVCIGSLGIRTNDGGVFWEYG